MFFKAASEGAVKYGVIPRSGGLFQLGYTGMSKTALDGGGAAS